jgi:hypothetical protein
MTVGYLHTIVATPQPGTTNTPVPAVLPAFVPVTATVVDTYSTSIITQTALLELYKNDIANYGNTLIELKKTVETIAYLVNTYNNALMAISQTQGMRNAISAMQVSSRIKTNNFTVNASDETPTMPNFATQLTESVRDSTILTETALAQGAITLQLNNMIQYCTQWLSGVIEPFTSIVSNWVTSAKIALTPNAPSNAQDTLTKINNQAGTPDTGNIG